MSSIPTIFDVAQKTFTSVKDNLFTPKIERNANAAGQRIRDNYQAQKEKDQTIAKEPYKLTSMRDLTYFQSHKDREVDEITKAYSSADPNTQPTRELKAAAVKGYLNKIIDSPEFQSLDSVNKEFILRDKYEKWVAPALKDSGINPPDFNTWVQGTYKPEKPKGTFAGSFASSFSEGVAKNVKLASNAIKTVFGNPSGGANDYAARQVSKRLDKISEDIGHISTNYNANFNTTDVKHAWLANTAGQVLATAPVYMTVAAATDGAGEAILGTGEGSVLTLAERAKLGGPKAELALKTLKEGAEVAGIEKGQGESDKQAAKDALGVMILGPALHGIFHGASVGFKGLMSKTLSDGAAKLAIGGEPLIDTISETIPKEAESNISIKDLASIEIPKSESDRVYSLVKPDDPDFVQAKQSEIKLREQWAQHFFPEVNERYPDKTWNNISKAKRAKIIAYMAEVQKSGAELMPLIHPEIAVAEKVNKLEKLKAEQPEIHARVLNRAKMFGIDPAQTLAKADAEVVADKKNLNSTTAKITKALEPDAEYYGKEESSDYEPLDGESASYNIRPAVSYKVNYKPTNEQLVKAPLEDFLSGTIKYLEKNSNTPSGHLYLESPKMHLLQVAYDSKAPANIKTKAKSLLLKEFKITTDRQKYEAGWLKFHIEKLRDAGHIDGGDNPGRIFRSTKLMIPRFGTNTQKQVTPEAVQMFSAEMKAGIAKVDPKLAASLDEMYKLMGVLWDKTNSSDKALDRLKTTRRVHQAITEFK